MKGKILVIFVIGMLVFSPAIHTVTAETLTCPTPAEIKNLSDDELRLRIPVCDAEIANIQVVIDNLKGKSSSLKKDIDLLNAQITKLKTLISQKTAIITKLSKEITKHVEKINVLDDKIDLSRDSLAQLIKKTNEIDQNNIMHVLLSGKTVSDFYRDLDSFASLKRSVKSAVDTIKVVKQDTETEKKQLETNKNQQLDAKVELESQNKKLKLTQAEQQKLLSLNEKQKSSYEGELADRQKRKNAILTSLFKLRDTGSIQFKDAYEYAKEASAKTGVRPALILAILTQESNMGKNVGTCNRAGDPASKSYRNIMPGPAQIASGKSSRDDQSLFLKIVNELGLDPDTTPLSCPSGGGWGGAMGPSQFIPSTWISIRSRVATAVGKAHANPWNPEDAIMATAIYLADRGAAAGGYTAERNAACRYYSGAACKDGRKPPNVFYGNSVTAIAKKIQETMIDPLQNL